MDVDEPDKVFQALRKVYSSEDIDDGDVVKCIEQSGTDLRAVHKYLSNIEHLPRKFRLLKERLSKLIDYDGKEHIMELPLSNLPTVSASKPDFHRLFCKEAIIRSLFSYYLGVQFPRSQHLLAILDMLNPVSKDLLRRTVHSLRHTYSAGATRYRCRLNAFVNYQLSSKDAAEETQKPNFLYVLNNFDSLVPEWLVNGYIERLMRTSIRQFLCAKTSQNDDITEQDACALFLARLHLEYGITEPTASYWLQQLSTGGDATDCNQQPSSADDEARKGALNELAGSDLLSSLVTLPSTLSHIIQLAVDQKLRPSATGTLISRIRAISCSAMLTMLVCAFRLKQVGSSAWQPYIGHILETLNDELDKDAAPENLVRLRFVKYTFHAFVDRPNYSVSRLLQHLTKHSLGFFDPPIAEAFRDCIVQSRGFAPIISHIIGTLASSGSEMSVECSALTLCLCVSSPADVLESFLTEMLAECLYERPTEMLTVPIAEMLSALSVISLRLTLTSGERSVEHIKRLLNNVKTVAIRLMTTQANNSDAHFIGRCNFAATFLRTLIENCGNEALTRELCLSEEELRLFQKFCLTSSTVAGS